LERHNQRGRGGANYGDDYAHASRESVMGKFVLTKSLAILGWLATAVMAAAAIGMFATWGS
jgi:Mn2+/Fe2+ NRAMP family transporter